METTHNIMPGPQRFALVIKRGREWAIVRNGATLATTNHERIAREIAIALNLGAKRNHLRVINAALKQARAALARAKQ